MTTKASNSADRVWTPRFVHLFIIEALMQIGLYSSRPLISNFAIFLGAAVATAATISGLSMIVALLMRPIGGVISDRVDKKVSLLVCAVCFFVGALGCAFAQSIEMMAFFVAVQGVAYCFKSISLYSLATLISPENRIGSAIGWISLLSAIGTAVGPLIGSAVRDIAGYQASFLFTAVLTGAAVILAILFKSPESKSTRKKADTDKKQKTGSFLSRAINEIIYIPVIPLALITVTAATCHGTLSALILTLQDMNYLENGALFFVAYSIVALVIRPVAGRLFDTYGLMPVVLPSMVITGIGMLALVFFQNTAAVIFCGVMLGIGQSSASCSLQAESVRIAPPEALGRATNTFFFGPDIAVGLGPAVSGAVLQAAGGQAMFAFNVAVILVGIAGLVIMAARGKKRQAA